MLEEEMSHYLVYWKPDTVAESTSPALRYSASKQYDKVHPGDVLWIVTSEGPDDLVLVGRQKVDHVVGEIAAKAMLGRTNLWPSPWHVITENPEQKANLDISRHAARLSFDGVVSQLPDGFTGQHLQAMRRLDFDSANLLERLWQLRDQFFDK